MQRVALTVIGHVRSPFTDSAQIPKGPSARHVAEGTLELLPELEPGLTDIEGFKPYLSGVPEDQLRRGWVTEAEGR
jgi:tRNA (Thr-GGU) A37 N-methylase